MKSVELPFKDIRLLRLNNREKLLSEMISAMKQKRGKQVRRDGKAEDRENLEMRSEAAHIVENRRTD